MATFVSRKKAKAKASWRPLSESHRGHLIGETEGAYRALAAKEAGKCDLWLSCLCRLQLENANGG